MSNSWRMNVIQENNTVKVKVLVRNRFHRNVLIQMHLLVVGGCLVRYDFFGVFISPFASINVSMSDLSFSLVMFSFGRSGQIAYDW